MPEIITFGEAMIRLSPPQFKRLEQAHSLDIEIGGAELNTAVGLARLGRSVGWVSRLPDNPLGRLLYNRAREAGVGVERVVFAPTGRVGLYFLEQGAAPRASSILYDRADSAMAMLQPGMIDLAAVFAGAKWFYLTGITAAISKGCALAALEALQAAKAAGLSICLDPNYRAKLWSAEACADWLALAIPFAHVLVTNPEDARRFFGVEHEEPGEVAALLVKQFGLRTAAVTLRQTPSVWKNHLTAVVAEAGQMWRGRLYEVEIVDRLGAGDAFVAGLLHGLLDGDPLRGLEYGLAMSALKHTIPGDFPWISAEEIEALIAGGELRIRR